jgi:4-nitrophenyl phosphatase
MTHAAHHSDFRVLAEQILRKEYGALQALSSQLDWQRVEQALDLILACEGMLWITGAGTSSSIARRLAHVLTCSGAPAAFLDAGQSQHGYSGIVRRGDVLLAFSRGGETVEVNHLLTVSRERGARVISILEAERSDMAGLSDIVIGCSIGPEHDAEGFIPFASTLVQAAIGDMLCAGVLDARGFSDREFAQLHPGGAVGKRLEGEAPENWKSPAFTPAALRGLMIDMDGVLWRGDGPLPGLAEFFEMLRERDIRFVLATNNPSKRPEGFAEKARRFGAPVETEDVVTCVQAVVYYLNEHYPQDSRIHVIGEAALKEQIQEAGYILADEDVVAVVVALERSLTYETFKRATLLIRAGAEFIGTNGDPSYPTEEGFVPGSGMMVIALAATSDTKPVIMGKPERVIFDLALEKLGLPREQVASVGDRLDTDIEGGRRLGLRTILMLSGIASRADLEKIPIKPDWVFEDLLDLTRALKG